MIIKKKTTGKPEISKPENTKVQPEADDLGYAPLPEVEPSFGGQIFEEDNFEMTQEELFEAADRPEEQEPPQPQEPEEIDLFNLDNIDFKQRHERRRGDRRRGFRRVDDRNLISRAREEADSIREAANKEGYQDGIKRAAEDIAQIKESFASFMNAPQEVFEYIAPDILEISIDIAQKIIKNEIKQNPEVVITKITEILKTLSKEEPKVTIRVNPAQAGIAKQGIPDMLNDAGLDAKIVVLPDETVTEGGCIVSTNNGVIDATIESQLAIIKEALKEV